MNVPVDCVMSRSSSDIARVCVSEDCVEWCGSVIDDVRRWKIIKDAKSIESEMESLAVE